MESVVQSPSTSKERRKVDPTSPRNACSADNRTGLCTGHLAGCDSFAGWLVSII
jgi:hypothetical protein